MAKASLNYRTLKLSQIFISQRSYSQSQLTNAEVRKKRNDIFEKELQRQLSVIPAIQKINVEYKGESENISLLMNKNLSTPFNCAMHISELIRDRSVIALVNGRPWDMHRPLEEDCELKFMHFKDRKPELVNKAFWRSCSFILGHILETVFKEKYYVELHSFPKPNLQSGSFVYDADLKIDGWKPSSVELVNTSRAVSKLYSEKIKFQRLEVDASIASRMFEDNRFKSVQVDQIAAQSTSGNTVTVYRMKDHVDMSRGPLISTTDQIFRFNITAVHEINSDYGKLNRVQGMAIPKQLPIHYWAYDLLCERAAKLNTNDLPSFNNNSNRSAKAYSS
ncbi:DgyrCDS6279 [Dimorphilus gyrociliatus]|uniref:DgyrCDS6279 n=1 Tax=Dimorphilus gyrociliatus TaxID=2664684 RepID=A0A7I8VPX2_9ANNE|nr:DgyrCDS6279 [Dimorphilus gyrociliatus]